MKKLICFDLDGTLTPFSTWEAFNTRLGISPEDDYRLFSQYKEGTLDYKAWIIELVRLYKENGVITKKDIEDTANDIVIRPEAEAAIADAKEKGYHVIMISGSIDAMAKPLAATLKIGEWFATNKAVFNDNDELIDIEDGGHEREAKLLLLKEFCIKNDYELSDVITVADGGNDMELFQHTKGIVLGDSKELKPLAWKQIDTLSELKDLL
ncbi:MAG: putative phosphoserine phosphatase [Candidatus Nomurabacteria bacterium]|nr:putative phosphoserine phosphatase [Candidatus Nomurabacteria bacterium]